MAAVDLLITLYRLGGPKDLVFTFLQLSERDGSHRQLVNQRVQQILFTREFPAIH